MTTVFEAGDPVDLDPRTGGSAADPISISDSVQDVTMSDNEADPQTSPDRSLGHDKNISSETSPRQEQQQVSQPNVAENLHLNQQLGLVEDQPQAPKAVWQDTHGVHSRESYQNSVIQAQHRLLEAHLKNARAFSIAPSAIVQQAYPLMTERSPDSRTDARPSFTGNETPRLPISELLGVGPNAVVARSSALHQNSLYHQHPHHGNSVPFTLPTSGPYVHPYPADPTATVTWKPTVPSTGASSIHTAAVEDVPERARVDKLPPLRFFPVPMTKTSPNPYSSAHPADTALSMPPVTSSPTKVSPISGSSADSSIVRQNPVSPLASTSTGACSLADQIYSSGPSTSDSRTTPYISGPFVRTWAFQTSPPPAIIVSNNGPLPTSSSLQSHPPLPATRSYKSPFVRTPALQNRPPLPPTEQQPAINCRVASGEQQSIDGAPADQTFSYSAPVPVFAPALITQAHPAHIPGAIVASNQTSVAASDPSARIESTLVTNSSVVSAPASRCFPLRTSSSSTPLAAPISSGPADPQSSRTFSNWPANMNHNLPVRSQSSNGPRRFRPAPVIDRSSYARAMTSAELPKLPQYEKHLFPRMAPPDGSGRGFWGFSSTLAELGKRIAAMARDDGFEQPPRLCPTRYNPNDKSTWLPEYPRPLYPPPGSDPARDGTVLRLFYNHTRTNGQYWPVSHSPQQGQQAYIC